MSYRIGTISVTNGSKAVVGTNTLFATIGVSAGDQLTLVDANGLATGSMYEVASVTDDTHLTLLQNYQGTTGSGKAYAIIDMAGDMTVANFARRLAQFYADINNGASPTVKGLVKLYAALGSNTDGALSQQALNNIINANNGIAGLDGSGKLATQRLYTNSANNVAGLDANAKVPYANLPVVGAYGSAIIEQGSNANGLYTLFADGTFICLGTYHSGTLTNPIPAGSEFLYCEGIPIPISVVSRRTIPLKIYALGSNDNYVFVGQVNYYNGISLWNTGTGSSSRWAGDAVRTGGNVNIVSYSIEWVAIGRY